MIGVGLALVAGASSDRFALDGHAPAFLIDCKHATYRGNGAVALERIVTSARATPQTCIDSDGVLKWGLHNLFLNGAAPVTQTVTVTSGVQYSVECEGTGTITLSGAGTGTVSNGSPVTLTASTTSLVCTLAGTVTRPRVYRSDLGGMQSGTDGSTYIETTSAAVYGVTRDYTDSANPGIQSWPGRTNLYLNSGAPVTQSITVSAVEHTLSFIGTGTLTLSGVSTAGPLVGTGTADTDRVSLTFTPTAGSLTLTLTGTIDKVQLEQGSAASPYIPTTSAAVSRGADNIQAVQSGSLPFAGYDQTKGTVVMDFHASDVNNQSGFALSDGTILGVIEDPRFDGLTRRRAAIQVNA